MTTIVLALHLLIAIVMIALILLQKSEGSTGAGFSGSPSVESMMRPRSRPNPLGRATSILGICFFATSLGLALIAKPKDNRATSIMNDAPVSGPVVPKIDDTPPAQSAPATPTAPEVPTAPGAPAVPNN